MLVVLRLQGACKGVTKKEANEKLRFAIATLRGEIEGSIWKRRLQTALIIKDELLAAGYTWQAARIDNWIHRLEIQEKTKDVARIQASESCRPAGLTSSETEKRRPPL